MSLNEKLATEVMGALKGFRMEARRDEYGNFFQVPTNATYALPGGKVILQSDWNPTTDLNQLRECYMAAEKDCSTRTMLFEFAFTDALQKEFRKAKKKYTHYETATAWVKHPEFVAKAILKAKGVSL